MPTKKPPKTPPTSKETSHDVLSPEEAAKRDSMEVQVLRAKDESPVVIMCKMPRPAHELSFKATIKKKGTDVEIEGTVKSEESPKK